MLDMCIMQHNDFDEVTLIIMTLSYFNANDINVLFVYSIIFYIFQTILCVQLFLLSVLILRFYLALLHDLWKRCESSNDLHNLHSRMTATR